MRIITETVGNDAPLTCYLLDTSDEMATTRLRPAVLVFPGGGYMFTSDREAEPIAMAYAAQGFNTFVLRYAVGDDAPWDRSYEDGLAALAWLRDKAAEIGIDPDRIAIVGFSAGGHLAASVGAAETRPAALVLGYPVTLAEFGPAIGKQIMDVPAAVDADYPPTFLFSTFSDGLVPIRNATALLAKLAEHGVPFETHIYLLGPHGLSLATPGTANNQAAMVDEIVAEWLPASVRFLHRVLGDFAVEGEPDTYAVLQGRRRFGLDMPIRRLLASPEAVAVIERHLPGATAQMAAQPLSHDQSLRDIARWRPGEIDAVLPTLGADLDALN